VRLQSRTTLHSPHVWKPESFAGTVKYLRLIYGGVLGILIMLCIYNMLLYFSLRENAPLRRFFHARLGLYQMGISGLSGEFLWPDSPWWAVRSIEFFGGLVHSHRLVVLPHPFLIPHPFAATGSFMRFWRGFAS
jgi:hypothetical protein